MSSEDQYSALTYVTDKIAELIEKVLINKED